MKLLKAFFFARKKHKGQVDKAGRAYIWHPLYVAWHCKGYKAKIAGLLHDTIEDTDTTPKELISVIKDPEIVEAVKLLSRPEGMDYFEYVRRVKQNPVAAEVKKNDLLHNMQLPRLKTITEKDLKRVAKYKKAFALLQA